MSPKRKIATLPQPGASYLPPNRYFNRIAPSPDKMQHYIAALLIGCVSIVRATEGTPSDSTTASIGNLSSQNTSSAHLASNIFTEVQTSSDNEVTNILYSVGLYIVICLVSLFTVVGNLMVISAVIIFRRLRKIPNMFIVSLATADLIMGGVVLPVGSHYVIGTKWKLGDFACDIWTSIDVLSVTASICTLCAISLDRFVAITMPFKYSSKMTRPRARFIIGFIWIISAAIAFVPINMGWWKTDDENDKKCYEDPECCQFISNQTYAVVSSMVSFYIPLFVMIFAYSIVFKIAIQKRQSIQNREGVFRRASMPGSRTGLLWGRGEYRAVFTMGIIMGTFVACWLPFFICNITQVFCSRCISETVFTIANWFGYVNSFFNPIIYCHSKEFRRAFKRMLLCGLCRDGYQQTSRASLSVSYTPSLSTRSSVRTESSLFQLTNFFLPGGSSGRRRTSRLSNTSKKPSPVNGYGPRRSSANMRSSNGTTINGQYGNIYGCRGNRSDYETASVSTNSIGADSNISSQPRRIVSETTERGNDTTAIECNLCLETRKAASKRVGISPGFNPILLPVVKKCRSKSTFISLTPDIGSKRVLFKTSSHHDLREEELDPDLCKLLTESPDGSSQSSIETTIEACSKNDENRPSQSSVDSDPNESLLNDSMANLL